MAGLSLISTYSSDSEDETDEDECVGPVKSTNRLPLPESIATWKGVAHHEEVVDDPSQHDERVRSFKHERGNWATLAYLDYIPSSDMLRWMHTASEEVPVKSNLMFQELHISVTKTLILKFHWIGSFVEEVKKLCEQTNQFDLELLNVQAYCNEERTRTFLGIECINNDGTLACLVKNLDDLLAEYGLPPFYESASYHVSFWWCLGNQMACLNRITSNLTDKLNKFLTEHVEDRYIHVNEIRLKTGNQLYAFKLK